MAKNKKIKRPNEYLQNSNENDMPLNESMKTNSDYLSNNRNRRNEDDDEIDEDENISTEEDDDDDVYDDDNANTDDITNDDDPNLKVDEDDLDKDGIDEDDIDEDDLDLDEDDDEYGHRHSSGFYQNKTAVKIVGQQELFIVNASTIIGKVEGYHYAITYN